MNINSETGALCIGGEVIRPKISRREFLSSPFGSVARQVVHNGPYSTFHVMVSEEDRRIGILFSFVNDDLSQVSFTPGLPENFVGPLDLWSEKMTEDGASRAENVVRASLGSPPYMFSWGNVSIVTDVRSGFGGALIRYSND